MIFTFTTFSYTVKPVLSGHSKIDKTKILKTNGSLMKVESIAECSPWSVQQYFWPALSNNRSWKPILVFFLSDRLRQVLLYIFTFQCSWYSQCQILYLTILSDNQFPICHPNLAMSTKDSAIAFSPKRLTGQVIQLIIHRCYFIQKNSVSHFHIFNPPYLSVSG